VRVALDLRVLEHDDGVLGGLVALLFSKTLAGYRSMVEHHIEEPLGDLAVSSLVPYQLQR
jgi:hypothetical protein